MIKPKDKNIFYNVYFFPFSTITLAQEGEEGGKERNKLIFLTFLTHIAFQNYKMW